MDILKIAEKTVKMHGMLKENDRVLVGLSGGADSTALLHVLCELKDEYNLCIAAAHINHNLRETADRDMNFCKELCKKLGVEFYCLNTDIKSGAEKEGMSCELYARQVRYDYFASLGYDKIATAHNKNDVAETLLFNFMRGTTVKGLSGIPYKRGNIIRPLLDIKKEDIVEFCRESGIEFVTDETNLEAIYTRNKIRLNFIPEIEKEINPGFVDVVTKNARLFYEDSEFLDNLAKKAYDGEITKEKLDSLEMPIKRRILQLYWKEVAEDNKNLPVSYIDDILMILEKGNTGSKIDLPCFFEAIVEYGKLIIRKKNDKVSFEYKIYPDTILNICEIGKTVCIRKTDKDGDIYLDGTEALTVRNRRSGDVFYPVGMNGKKKLSDYFTDKKISSHFRDKVPIILKDGEIISVGNLRADRRFYDKTKTAYKIEIKEVDRAE